MKAFARNQEQMREALENTMGGMFPAMPTWDEVGKQNMAMFEKAMQMFAPFAAASGATSTADEDAPADQAQADKSEASKSGSGKAQGAASGDIEDLQRKLDELQNQLQSLTDKKSGKKSG
jgi:polyhydroxyalkanoate synthesis regulator protein